MSATLHSAVRDEDALHYRLYLLGEAGEIVAYMPIIAESDEEAICQARRFANGRTFRLVVDQRLVLCTDR